MERVCPHHAFQWLRKELDLALHPLGYLTRLELHVETNRLTHYFKRSQKLAGYED